MAKEVKGVMNRDAAEEELQRFLDAMDLEFDLDSMDAEDQKGIKTLKETCIKALCNGSLVIDDKGQPVYTPKLGNTDPITFREPKGASLMAMDMKKKDHAVAKSFAVMADQTGEFEKRFSMMEGRDLKVCQAISMLFLA